MKRIGAGIMLIGLVGLVGLTGCSGGGVLEGGSGRAEPAPEVTATDEAGAPARRPAGVPQELCAFLKDEVPRLKERGSDLAGLARFTADYARWLGEDANRVLGAASELDAITTISCPQIRDEVLEALDRKSLAQALGRAAG